MLSLRRHFPFNQVVELGGELINADHVHSRRLDFDPSPALGAPYELGEALPGD